MKYFVFVGASGARIFSNYPDPTLELLLSTSQCYFSENFNESVLHVQSKNKMRLVFQQYGGLSFFVCSDQGESEAFLRLQLNLAYQLLLLEFGPTLHDKDLVVRGYFLKQTHRIQRLIDTMCLLCDENQSFLVQSIEELLRFTNTYGDTQNACNNILKMSTKDLPIITHALLFVNTQLVAQFSQSKAFELTTADVLLLIIWFWSQFHHKEGPQMSCESGSHPFLVDDIDDSSTHSNESFHSATDRFDEESPPGGELSEKVDSFKERSHQQVQNRVDQVTVDSSTTSTFTPISTPSRPIERNVSNRNDRDDSVLASSVSLPFEMSMTTNRNIVIPPQALHCNDSTQYCLVSLHHMEGEESVPTTTTTTTTTKTKTTTIDIPLNVTQSSPLNMRSYSTQLQLPSEKKFTEKNEVSTPLNRVLTQQQSNNSSNIAIIIPTNSLENVNENNNNMLGSSCIVQGTSMKEEFNSVTSSESNSPFVTPTNTNININLNLNLNLNNNNNNNNSDGNSLQNEQKLSDKEQTSQSENMSKSQSTLSQPNEQSTVMTTIFQNLYLRSPRYTTHCVCFSQLHPSLILVLICKHHSSKLSEEEKEKLRNVADMIKQNVMETYADYILSLEKTHTMIYYVSHIPGLVHFILVDRTFNRVLAPVITPLGGAQSKTNQDPEVRNKVINVIKRKIWDLVYQSQQFLSKGFCDMMMKKGHFIYSFKLWFEDTMGRILQIKEPIVLDRTQPLNREFYKKLQNRLFPSQRCKCYELYCLYLGFLPLKVIEQNNQALITLLLRRQNE